MKENQDNRQIEAHVWAQRRQMLKIIIVVGVLFALPLSWAAYNHLSPVVDRETLEGTLESLHQNQSMIGSDTDRFFVRLDSGDLVMVNVDQDRDLPFRKQAVVRIEKVVRESGKVTYRFLGYAD